MRLSVSPGVPRLAVPQVPRPFFIQKQFKASCLPKLLNIFLSTTNVSSHNGRGTWLWWQNWWTPLHRTSLSSPPLLPASLPCWAPALISPFCFNSLTGQKVIQRKDSTIFCIFLERQISSVTAQNSFKDGAGLPSQEGAEERAKEGRDRAGMKKRQQNKVFQ